MPPEEEAPVEPLVPVLLLVPADPLDEGALVLPPDAPMPEVAPEEDVPLLGAEDAEEEPDGVDTDPVAEPPVEPMPDAVPEALPEAVVPQAASAAAQRMGNASLINSFVKCRGEASAQKGCAISPMGVFPTRRVML